MNLNQITLPVKNIEESIRFYINLGFELIVDTSHYARFSCPEGDATFSLSVTEQEFNNGAVIYFELETLDQYVKRLQKQGFNFAQLPTDQRYLWREAILFDPDNNQLKFYWAGENRLNPPWKVKHNRRAI